jgi:tetratricopeptide (TPR) repeat protein
MARNSRSRTVFLTLTAVCSICSMPCATLAGQHDAHGTGPLDSTAKRFGTVSFANSGAPAAQQSFLRGLALLHNFEYPDAATAFRDAQARDPGFAMAYWGEAMTYNHGVWREQDSVAARAALARLGATPAERLAKAKTQREKDYLRAVDVLYFEARSKTGRDSAYAEEAGRLAKRYPADVDAQLFHALALLSLFPRTDSTYLRAAGIAEKVMRDHPRHPGALHYVIHAYDDPAHASRGLAAARAYSQVAPDAAHAQHMTSHIFVALGMWDDVVAANVAAIRTVTKSNGTAVAGAAACGHGGIWLHYAYLQQGRLADARRLSAGCRDRSAKSMSAASGYAEMRLQYIVDVDQTEPDLAPIADVSKLPGFVEFTQSFGTAYDALLRGDTTTAQPLLGRLHEVATTMMSSEMAAMMPEMVGEGDVIEKELRALALLRRDSKADAVATLREATVREDGLPFEFGPPEIEKPSHELLGEVLLATGQPAEARREFELALKRTPGRSLTLLDLARACRAAGDSAAATSAYRQLVANWRNADSTIAAVREARAGAR